MTRKYRFRLYLPGFVFFLCFLLEPVFPQVMGMTLDKGRFEIGYTSMQHKRVLENWGTEPVNWGTQIFYIRYGVYDWLTMSFEGFLSNSENREQFPQRDYRDIRFGAGIASKFYSVESFRFILNCQYSEWLMFDRSLERHHKQVQSLLSAIEIQYIHRIDPVEGRISVSPVFLFDQYSQYTQFNNSTDKSLENLGIAMGIDLTTYDHLRLYGQGFFTSFWQTRTGLGWVF